MNGTPGPVRREARALVRLATPLAAAQLGDQLLGVVDTAVVGRVDALELAAVGLGNALYFAVVVLGVGLLLALDPLVSQARGAGEDGEARRLLWQGIWIAAGLSVPLAVVCLAACYLLAPLGLAPDTAARTTVYMASRLPGLPFVLAFVAVRSYLQASGITRPVVVGIVLANVVNLPMSWLLVLGDGGLERLALPAVGLPTLGAVGAGLTTSACSLLKLVVVALALLRVPTPEDPGRRRLRPALARRCLRLGWPFGVQLAIEVAVFGLVAFLMGRIDTEALAAHQTAMSLAALTFMVPVGIGTATSVRVGHAVGRGDPPGTRLAGLVGIVAGGAFMVATAALFLVAPRQLAALITDRPSVLDAAVPLILVAAVFQVSDGVQAVASGALRGAGDTRWPLVSNLLGHYLIGLPVGLYLAFPAGLGASGLWWGLSLGLTVVAAVLTTRFVVLTRRPVARFR